MAYPVFSARSAILWGGLAAGLLDIGAAFALWATKGVGPIAILQSIASARLGASAFDGGLEAAAIGLFLHFGLSFTFAAGYVAVASRFAVLRSRPVICGLALGLLVYGAMTFLVVPLSHADFGAWPPPPVDLAASLLFHLGLFGLPIALAASRIRQTEDQRAISGFPRFSAVAAILWGGLLAGVLDIAMVLGYWASQGVTPQAVLQSIASSLLGAAAFSGGLAAAGLGLALHFAVSFVFAAGYVIVSSQASPMRRYPLIYGLVYGFVAHGIMSLIVVPLSRANFGDAPPTPETYALSLFIHLVLFGLPIAWAASRIRPEPWTSRPSAIAAEPV